MSTIDGHNREAIVETEFRRMRIQGAILYFSFWVGFLLLLETFALADRGRGFPVAVIPIFMVSFGFAITQWKNSRIPEPFRREYIETGKLPKGSLSNKGFVIGIVVLLIVFGSSIVYVIRTGAASNDLAARVQTHSSNLQR